MSIVFKVNIVAQKNRVELLTHHDTVKHFVSKYES